MKIYKADDKLEHILLNQGLIETTSEINKKKGKKSFKKSKSSRKEIYFDYCQIRILSGNKGQDERIELTELELKVLLLYFELNSTDFKELEYHNGVFRFEYTLERLKSLQNELKKLTELNLNKPRRNKLIRIFNTYELINLN